jgi:predicted phage-related endonuclease
LGNLKHKIKGKKMVGKVTSNKKASASILPAIMGHSKYDSRNSVLEKVCKANLGEEINWEGNEATDWGNTLEPVVLKQMADRLGITHDPNIDYAMAHPDIPLEASLDAIGLASGQVVTSDAGKGIFVMNDTGAIVLDGKGALECKVTSVRPEDQPDLARGPLQLQGQMMCAGYKWGAIGVLYQGICLRIFLFEVHAPTVKAITEAVTDFDRRVRSAPLDWYEIGDSDDACLVYGQVKEAEVPLELDASYSKVLLEYVKLKAQIKDANLALDIINAEVQKDMGNHGIATVGGFTVKWPMKSYKAQPEKVVAPKDAYSLRQKTISVREPK